MKSSNFSFNFDLQKILLWLLFQDFMVILRGSLAHGGMCVGDIVSSMFEGHTIGLSELLKRSVHPLIKAMG